MAINETPTGRKDIILTTGHENMIKGRTIRLAMVGKHGDMTYKGLTRDEAIALARTLLQAAEVPTA